MLLTSCSSVVRFSSETGTEPIGETPRDGRYIYGKASYYADKFDGRATASGEIFDQNEYTAAHRTLDFGTIVEVTNIKNGRTVRVVINDRGPFIQGRILDLSRAAAEKLDMIRDGVVEIKYRILE